METSPYTAAIMSRKNVPKSAHAPELELPRERLARLRKERGWTQVELAERIGITQRLVSDYERGRLRLNADIVVRLANALEIATDELLQPKGERPPIRHKPSLRVQRRMEKIQELPPRRQYFVLKALDALLGSAVTK